MRHLDAGYVAGLWAFRTLNNIKLYLLAFIKGLEAISLDSGEMNEYVVLSRDGDEPIALLGIEPFYSACFHELILLADRKNTVASWANQQAYTNTCSMLCQPVF